MTEEVKHTPKPWPADMVEKIWLAGILRLFADGVLNADAIAAIHDKIAHADAAHIVKCVNMHDELVRELRRAEAVLSDIGDSEGDPVDDVYSLEWVEKLASKNLKSIREALKKAGAL